MNFKVTGFVFERNCGYTSELFESAPSELSSLLRHMSLDGLDAQPQTGAGSQFPKPDSASSNDNNC